ncbi:hypothetical protein GXW82_34995 [Streptacidiphilus sp. 4-A2]|nr:hypothetical protein [Streptacidiphilus sp. 4-A2]
MSMVSASAISSTSSTKKVLQKAVGEGSSLAGVPGQAAPNWLGLVASARIALGVPSNGSGCGRCPCTISPPSAVAVQTSAVVPSRVASTPTIAPSGIPREADGWGPDGRAPIGPGPPARGSGAWRAITPPGRRPAASRRACVR